jgi:hypothetical protein
MPIRVLLRFKNGAGGRCCDLKMELEDGGKNLETTKLSPDITTCQLYGNK